MFHLISIVLRNSAPESRLHSPERIALLPDLPVELEVGHKVNVLYPILVGHRDLVTIGLQQLDLVLAEVADGDGEDSSSFDSSSAFFNQTRKSLTELKA